MPPGSQGTRYFEAGVSEVRLGKALAKHKRDEYRISSKVGRIILEEVDPEARNFSEKGDLFNYGRANKIVYDYAGSGTMKSIEGTRTRSYTVKTA